jgi:hypothetical protein
VRRETFPHLRPGDVAIVATTTGTRLTQSVERSDDTRLIGQFSRNVALMQNACLDDLGVHTAQMKLLA